MLWNLTSGVVVVALLPIIAGMGPLRELAYGLGGWTYTFPWAQQIPYEMKKDLFNYLAMAVIFWFAEHPAGIALAQVAAAAPKREDEPSAPSMAQELWLRDGRLSVLIDASDIVLGESRPATMWNTN